MKLGQKIKILRRNCHMTQADLSCGIVTRGMLSRIENGDAFPSLDTLCKIAQRLNVSQSTLLDESGDVDKAEIERISKICKAKLISGEYSQCFSLLSTLDCTGDPYLSELYIQSAFESGLQFFYSGDFTKARQLLSNICTMLPGSISYLNSNVSEQINFVMSVMDNIGNIEKVIGFAPEIPDFSFPVSLFFTLLSMCNSEQTDAVNCFLNLQLVKKPYYDYLKAILSIRDYKLIDAILLLRSIQGKRETPVFLSLMSYREIENCCKLCEDYKSAYEARNNFEELMARIK